MHSSHIGFCPRDVISNAESRRSDSAPLLATETHQARRRLIQVQDGRHPDDLQGDVDTFALAATDAARHDAANDGVLDACQVQIVQHLRMGGTSTLPPGGTCFPTLSVRIH